MHRQSVNIHSIIQPQPKFRCQDNITIQGSFFHCLNYFLYFPTDYGIKAEKNDNNELVIQTNKIDFTKLDYKTWNYDYEKIKGDVVPEVLGYVEVYRTDYENAF